MAKYPTIDELKGMDWAKLAQEVQDKFLALEGLICALPVNEEQEFYAKHALKPVVMLLLGFLRLVEVDGDYVGVLYHDPRKPRSGQVPPPPSQEN